MAPAGSGGGVGVVVALLAAALPHIGAFSIVPAPHRLLTHSGTRSFGHQVLPLDGGRLMVGAPAEVGEGRLFQCRVESGECGEVEMEGRSNHTHMGMALTRDGDGAIACGPGLARGVRPQRLHQRPLPAPGPPSCGRGRVLAPGCQGCLLGLVDLVFLFDGSSSINAEQFGDCAGLHGRRDGAAGEQLDPLRGGAVLGRGPAPLLAGGFRRPPAAAELRWGGCGSWGADGHLRRHRPRGV
ncbi:unnamed protein product, partial [Bubo scandiacus]